MMKDFEVLEAAYKGRLLFATDAEYRQAMGMTWETLRDNQADDAMLRRVTAVLDDECLAQCELPLRDLTERYVAASEAYIAMDWLGRRQMSSRRRFMRMAFRRLAMPDVKLTGDELEEFKHREGDEALLEQMRQIDAAWPILFCFDVMGPLPQRGRDGAPNVENMMKLLEVLKQDVPPMALVEKPAAFDIVMSELAQLPHPTRAQMWRMLDRVALACRTGSSPQLGSQIQSQRLCLPGIWIDNRDKGRSRFWVFPANTRYAFCYQAEGASWRLRTYEMNTDGLILRGEGFDRALLVGNGKISPYDFIFVRYAADESSVEFLTDHAPDWLDWQRLERLTSGNKFEQILADLYNPRSPQSMMLTIESPLMTNAQDAKLGQDADYVYISDFREADRFELLRREDDTYIYSPVYRASRPKGNFLEVEISEQHPLYALPITRRRLGIPTGRERQFYDCTASVRPEHTIIKYRRPRDGQMMLFFTAVGATFTIDEALQFGAKRITTLKFE